jgi:radical SAM protein with 4Fe4S-binding SPASM domain
VSNHRLPLTIEIEINSHCNMACDYCPNSVDTRVETGDMDFGLYLLLMSQLKERDYRGRIAFDFYNEPMLAKNFNQIVSTTKEYLPHCLISLYTNGTYINDTATAKQLIDLGIGEIVVTKHEDVEKFEFEKVYQALEEVYQTKYTLRNYKELRLTNRGGSLQNVGPNAIGNVPCRIPYIMMTVTVKGNVLPCFEDYKQENIMGNIEDEHILDIWNNQKFNQFRKDLLMGKRDQYNICNQCNRLDEDLLDEINRNNKDKHFLGSEEISAISQVIQSGNLFRYQSKESHCFKNEKLFAQRLKIQHALLVTSGTNALVAALMAGGIGPGDEVLIPAYTFVATAAAVTQVGAIPIVVNIDQQFGISAKECELKKSEKTRAIIPVHMDGLCCDLENILKFAKQYQLLVIEDACQAMGATYKGQPVGTFGDFGCFSLNMDKVITCGEGGVVVTNSRENYEKLCTLSDSAFSFSPHHQDFFKTIEPTLGLSMRVSEITGVMFGEQLKKLDRILEEYRIRKIIIKDIISDLKDAELFQGFDPLGECHLALHLRFKDPQLAAKMGKQFRNNKIIAAPVTMRPGHVAWKWGEMLGERSHIHDKQNPYLQTEKKYTYQVFDFLPSVDIVMSVLKIDIDLNWSLEKTKIIAEKIKMTMKEFHSGKEEES